MTTTPATTATEAQLAEKFPINADPYAVWFNPDATPLYRWAVNGESGECIVDVSNYDSAAKIAAALSGRMQVHIDVTGDIWMIHSQAVAALAVADKLDFMEAGNPTEELTSVMLMLRDMKAKLAKLADSVDAMQHTAPSKAAKSAPVKAKPGLSAKELTDRVIDYTLAMDKFFELAEGEIEKRNSTDFDGMEFLIQAAKSLTLRMAAKVCGAEVSVSIGNMRMPQAVEVAA